MSTKQTDKALRAARHARDEVRGYPGRRRTTRRYKRVARRAERRARRAACRGVG